MNTFEKIQLKDADFVTKGSHNLVYRHPTNPDCLVKVLGIVKVLRIPKGTLAAGLDQRFVDSRWMGNTRLVRVINRFRLIKAHVREFVEIVRLRFHDEFLFQPPPFMQKFLGFVDTNLGFAMLVKAEKDRDGNYAPTLATLIEKNQVDECVKARLEDLYKQLIAYDLILSDFHPDNVVYSYDETHGERFVLIDGFGDKNIIPLLRMSTYLRKRTKLRKINKFKAKVPQ